ncbi:MAG TPA: hypothetical protein VHY59_01730, partial [Chthoniobacterales bacterium]|nr:hypothetical protein [Chthoniobacterales bacterium]
RASRYAKQSRTRTDEIKPSLRDGLVFLAVFQAVNCQATIIQSLRDENTKALRLTRMGSCRISWLFFKARTTGISELIRKE